MTMSERIETDRGLHRGRTMLSARALHRLAVGAVKDASRVRSSDVSVSLSDDAGALRVSVVVPAVIATPTIPIPDQSARVRAGVVAGLNDLAGRRVGAVDVRFAGVHRTEEGRVV